MKSFFCTKVLFAAFLCLQFVFFQGKIIDKKVARKMLMQLENDVNLYILTLKNTHCKQRKAANNPFVQKSCS